MGDPELSCDALETSLGLRTAFRVANLKADLSSRSLASPLGNDGALTGFRLSSICHAICLKPIFTSNIHCPSCERVVKVQDSYTVGVNTSPQFTTHIKSGNNGTFISCPAQVFLCGFCRNRLITYAVYCLSCQSGVTVKPNDSVYLFLGSPSPDLPAVQAAIKDIFRDEIADLDMY